MQANSRWHATLCNTGHVTSELEHAVRAYRRSEKAYTARRRELQDAMMRATDAGIAQTQICKITGWTREQVRKMVAAARDRAAGGDAE